MPRDIMFRDNSPVSTVPAWGDSLLSLGQNAAASIGTAPAGAHTTLVGRATYARELVCMSLRLNGAGSAAIEFYSALAGYFPVHVVRTPGFDNHLARRIILPAGCDLVITCAGASCDYAVGLMWQTPATFAPGEAIDLGTINGGTLFASTMAYFQGGDNLAAGTYRITYVDSAYQPSAGVWAVVSLYVANPSPLTYYGPRIRYNDGAVDIACPGIPGHFASAALAEANSAGQSLTFTHTGGKIGMYLYDSTYGDNGGTVPRFKLERIG